MKRRSLVGMAALAALPSLASTPPPTPPTTPTAPQPRPQLKPQAKSQAKPLLSVSGHIGRVNNPDTETFDFSEAEFLKLTTASITTGTPWTPTSVFVGPLLSDVMHAAGVSAGTLMFKSLDDYTAPIPWDDLTRYGVILAHSQDGQRLSTRRWGPLWTIYPRDQNPGALKGPIAESRFIWQVDRIEAGG